MPTTGSISSSNASAPFGQGNRNRFAAAQNANVKLADKPAVNRNEFGGSVGGPVVLPGYKGKDRTFFFFAYEGFCLRSPDAAASIPAILEEASRLLNAYIGAILAPDS